MLAEVHFLIGKLKGRHEPIFFSALVAHECRVIGRSLEDIAAGRTHAVPLQFTKPLFSGNLLLE